MIDPCPHSYSFLIIDVTICNIYEIFACNRSVAIKFQKGIGIFAEWLPRRSQQCLTKCRS
ncbi:hypothetical protein C0J52_25380 [Blattella germanica]|nr:hypothetical protein C0J52_25380 [Blattella germanica]